MSKIKEMLTNFSGINIENDPYPLFTARAQALGYVQAKLDLQSVFYPGPQNDTLADIFPNVYYLDKEEQSLSHRDKISKDPSSRHHLIIGSYTHIPFRPQTFDALYYRDPDNMLNSDEVPDITTAIESTIGMFDAVKDGGIIIYDDFYEQTKLCPFDIGLDSLQNVAGLKKLNNKQPKKYPFLTVFQKTENLDIDQLSQNVESAFQRNSMAMYNRLSPFGTGLF